MTTSNFTEENQTIEEASDHEQNEYVTPLRPIHVQKKRKVASETDHNTEIVGLLKANLAQRQTNDIMLDNDGDRHFLLSLLPDFRRVPIDKKMDVKLAMIQSIKSALLPTQSAFNYNHVQHLPFYPSAPNPPSTQHLPIHKSSSSQVHVYGHPSSTHSHLSPHSSSNTSFIELQCSSNERTDTSSHPIPLNQLPPQQTDPSSIFLLITKAKTKIVELIINYYFSCTTLNTNRFRKKTSISIFSLP
ncbi:unnamed protein product [Acanthoscelides obtectus]|uniref:BESS domain-containing protein n=1 Tax=Acanthoscelides obtectus TaxID=200917 RepID=A0A9P0KLP7_ACAOB|nr:unnamed protein product [Acanthoscelides obtectus]CAK1641657.1 hypothetical protein AOBTE_LOCUS12535 [Acanthoscelides obtectus]